MKIRWSPEAAADFIALVEYIRNQNSSAADRVAHSMYDSMRLDLRTCFAGSGSSKVTKPALTPS
jgi:plasmid stabilization system protein ParE